MFTTAPFQHSIRTPGEKRQSLTSRCPPEFIILGKGQPGVTLSTPAQVNDMLMQNPRNRSSKPTSKTRLEIAAKVRLRVISVIYATYGVPLQNLIFSRFLVI